jgi:hypothetical protein
MPKGKALTTMEKIRFSYRFLSYLVDSKYTDKRRKFGCLIQFLCLAQPLIPLIEWSKEMNDPCAQISGNTCDCGHVRSQCSCPCSTDNEWKYWVYTWFERVSQVIVLESGEGPMLPISGRVWAEPRSETSILPKSSTSPGPSKDNPKPQLIGNLRKDGGIVTDASEVVGFVTVESRVIDVSTGKDLTSDWISYYINVYGNGDDVGNWGKVLGYIDNYDSSHPVLRYYPSPDSDAPVARYSSTKDTCDIEKVRIQNLDGSSVTPEEYDRMQRFLRLWRKLGWTIEGTDDAIMGLGKPASIEVGQDTPDSDDGADYYSSSAQSQAPAADITVDLIHQLVAVKKLLDITGFEVSLLLTFWTDIPISGEDPLYSRTFLTHNLIKMDPVFQADKNGNYLTKSEKITAHLPVLQAALRLKADDITTLLNLRKIKDELTLGNLSELYRFAKLAKFLAVPISNLADVISVFGQPFTNADATLNFLETWNEMNGSGFTFAQLKYMILGKDNISRPIASTTAQILRLAKTIFDGLVSIDKQQPDITQADVDDKVVTL